MTKVQASKAKDIGKLTTAVEALRGDLEREDARTGVAS